MPRVKIFLNLFIVLLAIALIGGATVAWFTAKAELDNTFTAGTVLIEADAKFDVDDMKFKNVNPGDCYRICWEFENVGTKAFELRIDGEGFWTYDWDWIDANWEALCFSTDIGEGKTYPDYEAFKAAYQGQEPPMGSENNPVFVIPDPTSDFEWAVAMVDINGDLITDLADLYAYHFYYLGGPVQPGETVELCLYVAFDGNRMGNIFQAADFTLRGTAEAIQWSNNAPSLAWGASIWSAVQDAAASQLITAGGSFDHPYFIGFDFDKCITCDNGNGNGPPNGKCTTHTAFGGDTAGEGAAWWYYWTLFDSNNGETQKIWASQDHEAGTVTVLPSGAGKKLITITFLDGWGLDNDEEEAVKIQGYDVIPSSRPEAGLFTTYKGNALVVEVDDYSYYVIHLDVKYCPPGASD